jgi:hypothetical protein
LSILFLELLNEEGLHVVGLVYCRTRNGLRVATLIRILRNESALKLFSEKIDVLLSLGHLNLHSLHASTQSSVFILSNVVLYFQVSVVVFHLLTFNLFELLSLVSFLCR